jgi:hypothetical protein
MACALSSALHFGADTCSFQNSNACWTILKLGNELLYSLATPLVPRLGLPLALRAQLAWCLSRVLVIAVVRRVDRPASCPVGRYNDKVAPPLTCAACAIGSFNSALGPANKPFHCAPLTPPSIAAECMRVQSMCVVVFIGHELFDGLFVAVPVAVEWRVGFPSYCSAVCSLPFLANYCKCWPSTTQSPFVLTQYATSACRINRRPLQLK